jgi:hypothetical protein
VQLALPVEAWPAVAVRWEGLLVVEEHSGAVDFLEGAFSISFLIKLSIANTPKERKYILSWGVFRERHKLFVPTHDLDRSMLPHEGLFCTSSSERAVRFSHYLTTP